MTKQQGKRLTAVGLKKLESTLNERIRLLVYGNQFNVNIHTFFRESLIENIITNYVTILQELQEGTEVDDTLIKGSLGVFNTLVLREFTDLPIPKTNDIESLIVVSNTLLDTGIMKEIYDAIPPEQLIKIEEKLKSVQSNFEQVVGTLK
ncbi:hypothetical protein [Paenibacillus sp. FSL K6-2524]|uniref:hypothetical protein n=1 Tax=Paenibacillus sp. FSL K6-2524 TaxID=2954516 RepID=UPI0030F4E87F